MKKRILSCFLALAMALSLLPMSVLAVGGDETPIRDSSVTSQANNITVNKTVSSNQEDGYTVTMEAYAENRVTSSTTTKPLDIVLVLDVSGSMDDTFSGWPAIFEGSKRITALKNAVTSFIDSVTENAKETGANHQIGIVTFASQAQIINNLTPVSSDADTLKSSVDDLTADGATRADYGMEYAQSVLESARGNSEKIVIMFTDGEPTSRSSYEDSVAHGAVNTAEELKEDGVTVYTIGIFSGANPDSTSDDANKFMNAVSSNYPDAFSESEVHWIGFIPHYIYEITLGEKAEGKYYFASDNAEGLENVFETIADTVTSSTLKANPDNTAVLSDTLSQYFNFPEGLTDGSNDITVKQVPVTGKSGDSYSWGGATDVSDDVSVTVNERTGKIEITGFDYKDNAVTETTEGGQTTYKGSKLVVSFPIVVDTNACLEAHIKDGYYPTNNTTDSRAGLFYKSKNAKENDTHTDLSTSPAVLLTDLDANGTDVTVQVYVDGQKVGNPLAYVTLTRDAQDTPYNYFQQVGEVLDGVLTYDFNYSPDEGGHDCVDIQVDIIDGDTYLLQGVRSYQSYGMNGTKNVTTDGDSYIIDNVTASKDSDVDCTIYLYTKYSVEYYQGNTLLKDSYSDTKVYIAGENVTSSTAGGDYPTSDTPVEMDWKNDGYSTSIALPSLPTVTGSTVDGWFLGSASGTEYDPATDSPVAVSAVKDSAAKRVIQFYATTTSNEYSVTYEWSGFPEDADPENLPTLPVDSKTHTYNSNVSLVDSATEYMSDTSTHRIGHDIYTFKGWSISTPDGVTISENAFTMPASNVTVSGTWTKTGEDLKYTVTYEVTSSKNPSDYSPEALPNIVSYYEGDSVTVADPLTSNETTNEDGVSGTWTFSGWSTEDVTVINNQFTMPADAVTFTGTWIFTPDTHTITINYVDGEGTLLKDVYKATQNDGSSYSFYVSEGSSGNIPFIIEKEGTQYVFDHFTTDSDALSGTLTGNIDITAVYLVDENENNVPDVYEATVTYKVVNGTWSDDTATDKTETFALKEFDSDSNIWVETNPAPILGDSIPTGMKPVTGYAEKGSWNTEISENTPVTEDVTYTYIFKEIPAPDLDWDVSRSKTATNLDKNYESQVTLSLPSAEEELASDVVFVLDKSTSAEVETQILSMLQTLNKQIENTDATIKVGVVVFNQEAHRVLELTELNSENMAAIEAAIAYDISSGTNTHAGLLAGKAMLDEDTSVDSNRKYLIFVSDGITYMYNEEPTVTAWSFLADSWKTWAGPENWSSKYGNTNAPEDWGTWLTDIEAKVSAQGTTYEYPYGGEVSKSTPQENWQTAYANSIDKALYLTYETYQEIQEAGYQCYAVTASSNANYPWATSFMEYLSEGQTVSFEDIQEDIYYLVDAGSYVVDVIGSGTDNKGNAYNFDFVNQAGKLTLKVGEKTYSAVSIPAQVGATASYGFGDVRDGIYSYVLNYYQNGTKDVASEHFVWEINVPVSNFAHVQLTYSVKLTNPQSRAGTYGQYDADGSEGYTSLYTNTSAVLTPVDSNGVQGPEQIFAKPTVSYTIKKHDGGGTVEPPVLDTENHYGYIVGYDDGTVRPNGKITRAEVATIFFRLLTDESRDAYWCQTNDFSDVSASDWFNNAISTLTNAGILDGYEDGTFRPNGNITRAEFATIAVRFFDLTYEGEDLFPDISDHWARDYINQAAAAGFVNGYEDGTFRPNNAITRAEAVTLVNRTLERKPHKAHLLADMIQWPDNMDQTTWYYADIQEATNSHEYYMTTSEQGEEYEIWTELLPMRDWPALEKEWSDANSSTGADVTR